MPTLVLKSRTGGSVPIEVPEPGSGPSCFLVGLPKAGSTLLNRLMRPLAAQARLSFFSLPNSLNAIGVVPGQVEIPIETWLAEGYAYGGFRGVDALPALPAFANGRTVLLIRDPRDMLTSLYFSEAYSHRPPGTELSTEAAEMFEARRDAAQHEDIDTFVRRRAPAVLSTYQTTIRRLEKTEHRLYRYEDIIFSKLEWATDMLAYLKLEVRPNQLKNIVARHDVVPSEEDKTQHIRRVAPGDHRDKLPQGTIDLLNSEFDPILRRFNYL